MKRAALLSPAFCRSVCAVQLASRNLIRLHRRPIHVPSTRSSDRRLHPPAPARPAYFAVQLGNALANGQGWDLPRAGKTVPTGHGLGRRCSSLLDGQSLRLSLKPSTSFGPAMARGAPHERPKRDQAGRFFLLDHEHWAVVAASGDLNMMCAFLVVASGTGRDQRSSKWSTGAAERYLGMRRATGRAAIDALFQLRVRGQPLLQLAPGSMPHRPEYLIASQTVDRPPIFLPNQLITGFVGETSVLRRIREAGDPALLRLLIDLYNHLELGLAFALDPRCLCRLPTPGTVRKIADAQEFTIYNIDEDASFCTWISDDLLRTYGEKSCYDYIIMLYHMGIIYTDTWLVSGHGLDPLMPLPRTEEEDYAGVLASARAASQALLSRLGEDMACRDMQAGEVWVPLYRHIAGVACVRLIRLRVEPDTAERREAHIRRQELTAKLSAQFDQIAECLP